MITAGTEVIGEQLRGSDHYTGDRGVAEYEGTAGDDTYIGGDEDDQIYGNEGNDTLRGGGGNDTIFGYDGNDDILGGPGNDYLVGGTGDDTIAGESGDDELYGLEGDDNLSGGIGNDTLRGGLGNDLLDGGDGDDYIDGDAFVSAPEDGDDRISGGKGNDTIDGGGGNDIIEGGAGDDHIKGGGGADIIDGGDGDDYIDGFEEYGYGTGPTNDVLLGGAGNDRISIGSGDSADGGTGINTLYLNFYDDGVAEGVAGVTLDVRQLQNGSVTINGATLSNFTYVPYLVLTRFDDDVTAGVVDGVEGVSISGLDGNDRLVGSNGVDSIDGGDGDDIIFGGIGFDPDVHPGQDRLNGGAGNDTIYSDAGGALALGGSGNDRLFGGSGDDSFYGEDGDDYLEGAGGDDGLQGGEGADTFVYTTRGFGKDIIADLTDEDRIDLSALGIASFEDLREFISPHGKLHVDPYMNGFIEFVFDGQVEQIATARNADSITAANFVFNVSGNSLSVQGTDGADILFGGNGNDTINAGGGDDTLIGGGGQDVLNGGAGTDLVSYAGSLAGVIVNLANGAGQGGRAQGDSYTSIEGIRGSAYADTLTGNAAANLLEGGLGDDVLKGGGGNDNIDGGAGADTAVFSGNRASYAVTKESGGYRIVDQRGGNNDGSDLVLNVEAIRFADGTIASIELLPNTLPVAIADAATTIAGIAVTTAVLSNDTDADGDVLTVTNVGNPLHGTAKINSNGTITYTPQSGYVGVDSFTYTIADIRGGTSTQSVTVSVGTMPQSDDWRLFTQTWFLGEVGGSGQIFGTAAQQAVIVADLPGKISLDPSFNRGGDVVRLKGDAADWQVVKNGSAALFSDGDTFVEIPGGAPVAVAFDDVLRFLRVENGVLKIAGQIVDNSFTEIVGRPGFPDFPFDPIVVTGGQLLLAKGGAVTVGGSFNIFGTMASEEVTLLYGNVRLDPSFSRGGDTIHIAQSAGDFMASRSGSSLFLDSDNLDIVIPVGSATTLIFADGDERNLVAAGGIMLGDQLIDFTPVMLSDFA